MNTGFRESFGEPDAEGVVRNSEGVTGFRGQSGFIFTFRDEANKRYARLLAQSPFHRRPCFIGAEIEYGKLVLQSSGRRVVVEDDTWPALADALLRLHFEYAPKVSRVSESIG